MRGGAPPPRPRRPSVSPDHYDYRTMQDQRRIAFLRMQQHEHIGRYACRRRCLALELSG